MGSCSDTDIDPMYLFNMQNLFGALTHFSFESLSPLQWYYLWMRCSNPFQVICLPLVWFLRQCIIALATFSCAHCGQHGKEKEFKLVTEFSS